LTIIASSQAIALRRNDSDACERIEVFLLPTRQRRLGLVALIDAADRPPHHLERESRPRQK